jgi:hypothetical protein
MSNNRILIDQSNNTVTTDTTSTQNNVILSPDNPDVVRVVENTSNIITIGVPGPRGLTGQTGSYDPNYNTGSFSGSFTGVLIGTASYSPNLYNSDGSLTGNRLVSTTDKRIILTGQNSTTPYTFNFLGTRVANSYPVKFAIDLEHTFSSSISPPTTFTLSTSGYSTGSNANMWQTENYLNWAGAQGNTGILYGHYLAVTRGSGLDVTTTTGNSMRGFFSIVGHSVLSTFGSTTENITTGYVSSYESQINNWGGTMTNAYNYIARTSIANSLVANNTRNATVTNLYNIYVDNQIGGNYASASVTNLYALYINSTIGTTATITNRWGIYAPDTLMSHSIQGRASIPNITGSLFGTASWARNALTASSADNFTVRESITGSSALFTGTITAQTLVVQTITSSIDYVTGSTRFGSQLTDTHAFTGSVSITGSLTVDGALNATASNAVSSSYAVTASYALNAGGAGASVAANIFNYYNFT